MADEEKTEGKVENDAQPEQAGARRPAERRKSAPRRKSVTKAETTASEPTPRVSIVLPCLNEAAGLERLLPRLKEVMPEAEVVVVDDGSSDGSGQVAERHGARVVRHPRPLGNGAAIKSGARGATGEILVFMDADGQHRAQDIPRLLARLDHGYDMVVGARRTDTHATWYRGLANWLYNRLASYMVNQQIPDLTSGFRAVRASYFREFLHLLPNGFSYPTTITMAFFRAGYAIDYIEIAARQRVGASHIKLLRDGFRFLLIISRVGTLYSPLKIFMPVSGIFFLLASFWYLVTLMNQGRFTNMSALLYSASVVVFLIGLVSEQITMLLYERHQAPPGKD